MSEQVRKPPPGRKGGTVFPRIDLEAAVAYAIKLVSKTHTGPQSLDVIETGVFGAGGWRARTRSSALKQYGLMEGDKKKGFRATQLARDIVNSPEEERFRLLQRASLAPRVFAKMYEAFQGDVVSEAKLKQASAKQGVHPEETGNCAALFTASLLYSRLGTQTGDLLAIQNTGQPPAPLQELPTPGMAGEDDSDAQPDERPSPPEPPPNGAGAERATSEREHSERADTAQGDGPRARAVINVNVTLDSSLDTEKLEKQLQLLRRYGAI